MEDYLNGGDDLSAVAAAAGIQNLFGNQTAALNFYNELVNARCKKRKKGQVICEVYVCKKC
jgi:hypothetical protein